MLSNPIEITADPSKLNNNSEFNVTQQNVDKKKCYASHSSISPQKVDKSPFSPSSFKPFLSFKNTRILIFECDLKTFNL